MSIIEQIKNGDASQPLRKKTVVTEPVIWSSEEGDITFDFEQETVILRDKGCFVFQGPESGRRPARVVLKKLRIFDERSGIAAPAITFRRLNNSQCHDLSVNQAFSACSIEHCWDFTLTSSVFIHGRTGLSVISNTNGFVAEDVTIEKMTEDSVLGVSSRNLIFTETCKIHGIPEDTSGRTVANFINCGSVMFRTRLMHCVPHRREGLICFNGPKTEAIVCEPWILRSAVGPAVVFQNVPKDILTLVNPIEMRRKSLVDPK